MAHGAAARLHQDGSAFLPHQRRLVSVHSRTGVRRVFAAQCSPAVGLAGALVSFLAVAAVNVRCSGDWTGQAVEHAQFNRGHPLTGILMNGIILTVENLVPPICPFANALSAAAYKIVPASMREKIEG